MEAIEEHGLKKRARTCLQNIADSAVVEVVHKINRTGMVNTAVPVWILWVATADCMRR